jgi:hypothetical protein
MPDIFGKTIEEALLEFVEPVTQVFFGSEPFSPLPAADSL